MSMYICACRSAHLAIFCILLRIAATKRVSVSRSVSLTLTLDPLVLRLASHCLFGI
jgi:hypothetical protein